MFAVRADMRLTAKNQKMRKPAYKIEKNLLSCSSDSRLIPRIHQKLNTKRTDNLVSKLANKLNNYIKIIIS